MGHERSSNEDNKSVFNMVLKRSLNEIEALGFTISDHTSPGLLPYEVVGGRSNQRRDSQWKKI